jgi:WD40 repeat protein
MATGKMPFTGIDTVSTLMSVASDDPPAPQSLNGDIPAELSDFILKLLEKEPEDRPASAGAAARTLRGMERGSSTSVMVAATAIRPAVGSTKTTRIDPSKTPSTAIRPRPRSLWPMLVLLGLVLVGGGIAAAFLLRIESPDGTLVEKPAQNGPNGNEPKAIARIDPSKALGESKRQFTPGPEKDVLPGPIARPAAIAGLGRWQARRTRLQAETPLLAWSPDGKSLLAAADSNVIVYDGETLQMRAFLPREGWTSPERAAWSVDGKKIAVAYIDGKVRIWTADGTPGPEIEHKGVRCVAWHPSGWITTSGNADNLAGIRLWRDDGKLVSEFAKARTKVLAVEWSRDGNRLASLCEDGKVRIWGTTGDLLAEHDFGAPAVAYGWIAWTPKGALAASAEAKGGNRLLLLSPEGKSILTENLASDRPPELCWDRTGTVLSVVLGNKGIRSFDDHGKVLPPRFNFGLYRSLAWNPSSDRIAISSYPADIRICDATDKILSWLTNGVSEARGAWNASGNEIAVGGWGDDHLLTFDGDGRRLRSRNIKQISNRIIDIAWSPTAPMVANCKFGQDLLEIVNLETDAVLESERGNGVVSACWSSDGSRVVTVDGGGQIRLWDANAKPIGSFPKQDQKLTQVRWSPDGKWIVTTGETGELRLWTADGTEHLRKKDAWSPAWTSDSKRLAIATPKKLLVVDLAGEVLKELPAGDFYPNYTLAWGPGDKRIAQVLRNDILLHDVETGARTSLPNPSGVRRCDWSKTDRILVSQVDGTFRVWDPNTRQVLWSAMLLGDGITAAFDTAGNLIDGDPAILERELVYLVESPTKRLEVLKLSEFRARVEKLLAK